jgi:hypothetical protein
MGQTNSTHGTNKFIRQLTNQLYEQTLIDKAYSVLLPNQGNKPSPQLVLELPIFAIDFQAKTSFRINGKFRKQKIRTLNWETIQLNVFFGPQNKVANREGLYVFA